MGLVEEAAALYGVPLEGFTARRNARAKELKGQDRELADAVARLPKPAVAAAALNRLARERADLVEHLLQVGAELREAQSSGDGARLRELSGEAHAAVRQVLAAAEGLNDTQRGQAERTLRAAMADEGAATALRAGLLVKPLAAAGFGPVDLAGAVAAAPAGPPGRHLSVVRPPGERREQRSAARQRQREERLHAVRLAAERALDALEEARDELRAAAEALERAEQEREAAAGRVEDLRSELREAEDSAATAAAAVAAARRDKERAETRDRAALRAAERAKEELDSLG